MPLKLTPKLVAGYVKLSQKKSVANGVKKKKKEKKVYLIVYKNSYEKRKNSIDIDMHTHNIQQYIQQYLYFSIMHRIWYKQIF